jgi:hypothetical protein
MIFNDVRIYRASTANIPELEPGKLCHDKTRDELVVGSTSGNRRMGKAELVKAHGTVSSGTEDFDLDDGVYHSVTVGGDFTVTFSNWEASGILSSMTVRLTNAGAHTITWPAAVTWVNGSEPDWAASGNGFAEFWTEDGGTVVFGRDAAAAKASAAAFNIKDPVDAATTANITLSGEQTIDGQALTNGDTALVKDQTDASENGIYTVSTSTWTRLADADSWAELVGAIVFVSAGTTNGSKTYACDIAATGTLETDDIDWVVMIETSPLVDGGSWD